MLGIMFLSLHKSFSTITKRLTRPLSTSKGSLYLSLSISLCVCVCFFFNCIVFIIIFIYDRLCMQIGNAVINFETDKQGMYDYLATHAIASDRDVSEIRQRCIPFKDPANISRVCSAAMNVVNSIMFDIDLYNIYAPLCISPNTTFQPKKASVSDIFFFNYFFYYYV
jgi:hypothetical protein